MPDDTGRRGRAVTMGAVVVASLAGIALGRYALDQKRAGRCAGHLQRNITIGRPTADLYAAWLELLPRTMEPVADVALDANHIRWTFPPPLTRTYRTAIEHTRPGEVLSWKNMDVDADAKPFSGSVTFKNAPADRGSEVALRSHTALPDAIMGPAFATALRRFKSLVETGELPSLERNPSGRSAPADDGEE